MSKSIETQIVVLGSGPGGYAAAFRAADLGKKVTLIEKRNTLGGVCLNVGCIPSKALLHVAKVIEEAQAVEKCGVSFGKPSIDLNKMRSWKNQVIKQLTGGLQLLAKKRKVQVVHGTAHFTGKNTIVVTEGESTQTVQFEQCIIAAGSEPVMLPFIPEDARIFDSTGALQLEDSAVSGELLVLGGGIIGAEMATVYSALGARVSVVERSHQIIPGADTDIVKPLFKRMRAQCADIMLETAVSKVEARADGLWVTFEGAAAPEQNPKRYDNMLVAVGRRPNPSQLKLEATGVSLNDQGFIAVNAQMQTNIPHIYAIGDVVGNPMLAHKAAAEGHVAAEVASGKQHSFDPKCIPSVAYTDPELAWVGYTEAEAKAQGIVYKASVFPWMASGKALAQGCTEGLTKLLFNEAGIVIGGAVVGSNAGDLIAEVALAIEMGCDAEDMALTIHPHPTLSESFQRVAEMHLGVITDL